MLAFIVFGLTVPALDIAREYVCGADEWGGPWA